MRPARSGLARTVWRWLEPLRPTVAGGGAGDYLFVSSGRPRSCSSDLGAASPAPGLGATGRVSWAHGALGERLEQPGARRARCGPRQAGLQRRPPGARGEFFPCASLPTQTHPSLHIPTHALSPASSSFTKHILFTFSFSPRETVYSGALSLTVLIPGSLWEIQYLFRVLNFLLKMKNLPQFQHRTL